MRRLGGRARDTHDHAKRWRELRNKRGKPAMRMDLHDTCLAPRAPSRTVRRSSRVSQRVEQPSACEPFQQAPRLDKRPQLRNGSLTQAIANLIQVPVEERPIPNQPRLPAATMCGRPHNGTVLISLCLRAARLPASLCRPSVGRPPNPPVETADELGLWSTKASKQSGSPHRDG
jgi:hypothetical protein